MAALVSCCFGCCEDNNRGHVTLKEMPTVQLDTHHMGKCCDLTFQIHYIHGEEFEYDDMINKAVLLQK